MSSLLALGFAIGAYTQRQPGSPGASSDDGLAQRRLDDIDANVRKLTAAYQRTAAALAVQSVALAAAPSAVAPADIPNALAPRKAETGESAVDEHPPSPAQISAADQLATLTDRIMKSGRLTGDDRRALRDAAAEADPLRRDDMLLSLVRAVNAQQVKPTEPGPFFKRPP
jgi:hypothetical protein